ncbi:hypothetical protein [Paenibacillus sp. D51F]
MACRITMADSGESHVVLIGNEPPAQAGDSYIVDGIQVFGRLDPSAGRRSEGNRREIAGTNRAADRLAGRPV